MGGKEVEAFLSMLANVRKVSPSTHRQALSAWLFLYKEVLELELPWMQDIGRPVPTKRIPVILTADEVARVLLLMNGVTGLLARLIYGTGLRLREALSLRIKDVDFGRRVIIVREGKGGKDIRTVQELLGHSDVSTTMIYTHVLKIAAGTTPSPLDALGLTAASPG